MRTYFTKLTAVCLAALLALGGTAPVFAAPAENEISSASESPASAAVEDTPYAYALPALGQVTSAAVTALGAATTMTRLVGQNGSVRQTLYCVESDPKKGGRLLPVDLGGNVVSRTYVSGISLGDDADLVPRAAVNADFFSFATGVPMGVFVLDGRLVSSSDGRDAVGFSADGAAFMGKVGERLSISVGDTALPIAHLNKYPSVYGAYLLTGDYAATTGIAATLQETEYILELAGDVRLGESTPAVVREIRENLPNGEIPSGCAVLCVPQALENAAEYARLTVGTEVQIVADCQTAFAGAVSAVGGGDILLDRGVLQEGRADEDHEKSRQPRTAVGIKEDGKLGLFVLDGRQSHSAGLKIYDLCELARALGYTSLLNLDGGGSSVLVTFAEDAVVQNKPSDGVQRKVTNALLACEDARAKEEYILTCAADDDLLLSGADRALALTLSDAAGNAVETEWNEENTTVTFDGGVAAAEFADGKLRVTAGDAQGLSKLHIETRYDGHSAETDVYLDITKTIDALAFDEDLLLSGRTAPHTVKLAATYGGKGVDFGQLAELRSENPKISLSLSDGLVTVTPEEVADGDEPLPLHGRVGASLCGKVAVLPTVFDDAPFLDFLPYLAAPSVNSDGYTLEFATDGGVTGQGAYVLTAKPAEPEMPAESETTTVPEETIEPETTAEPEATTETEETAEPEAPVEPAPVPDVAITLTAASPVSRGYAGHRLWLWADGLAPSAEPYAVFETEGTDGTLARVEVPYHCYYDFLDWNGRALLLLDLDFEAGTRVRLCELLHLTAPGAQTRVSIGPLYLADEYDTNRYTDMNAHWSSYYVNALSFMDILGGSEDLHGNLVFRPDDFLTREQFAKVLSAYLKIDLTKYADVSLDFDDAAEISPWALPYVKAAVGAGLMRGRATVRDTVEFAPRAEITRQEAIYVLGGQLGEAYDSADRPLFTDDELIAPFARQNLLRAAEAGLLSGYEDGSIRPRGSITRAEAATLVLRLYHVLYGHTVVS